jgi:hypothetical protein
VLGICEDEPTRLLPIELTKPGAWVTVAGRQKGEALPGRHRIATSYLTLIV